MSDNPINAKEGLQVSSYLYGLRLRGVSAEQALSEVTAVLPGARPNRAFPASLRRAEQEHPAEAVAR